jgi:hypothetical protein
LRLTPVWLKWAVSGAVILTGILVVAQLASCWGRAPVQGDQRARRTCEILWIRGPFTLSYVGVLLPRAATAFIQDRYLLVLAPSVIVFLLFAHRRWVAPVVPSITVVILVLYGLSAVAWNHDNFANARATKTTIDQMLANGESMTSIQAGLGIDGWTQTQYHGFINDQRMRNPPGAYDPALPHWELSDECNYFVSSYTPVIRPKHYIFRIST